MMTKKKDSKSSHVKKSSPKKSTAKAKPKTKSKKEQTAKSIKKRTVKKPGASKNKQSLDKLMEATDFWRSFVKNAPNFILLIDKDHIIQYINHPRPGIDSKDVIGKSVYDFIEPEFCETARECINEVFRTGKPSSYESMATTPGKEKKWYESLLGPIFSGDEIIAISFVASDITDRKRAEEALRENEERYRLLTENSSDVIWSTTLEGQYTYVSPSVESLSGYTSEETLKMKNVSKTLVPESLKRIREMIRTELALPPEERSVTKTVEAQQYTKDGSVIDTEVSVTWVLNDQGEPAGFQGVTRNIAERKRAEEVLRESEEKYRGIFDESVATIYVFDKDKNFIDSNQAGLDLLGYSMDEMLSMSIADVDADPVVVLPAHKQLLEGDRIINYEHRLKRKDGSIISVLNNSRPLTNESGNVVGMQSTLVDITERKQAEEALRESEYYLKKAQEVARIGHWSLDPKTQEVTGSNELFKIFGLEQDEMTLEAFASVVHPEDLEYDMYHIERGMEQGESWDIEHRLLMQDGTVKVINAKGEAIKNEAGEIVRLVGTVQDITERKRMEEELQKADKLESVGILAGGIAHDFNNILTALWGNIQIAMLNMEGDRKTMELLIESEKACKRARDLTQQLLTFAKGGAPIKKTASIVDLIRESARFALRGSNVWCEFSIEDDLLHVDVDEGQINQVINNIVINAGQAMPEGGVINVYADNIVLGFEQEKHGIPLDDGKYVMISIEDHGMGISKEHLLKIFDPYFTSKQSGSGLGLATSYSIIDKHGGHIQVKSELEKGATFEIYLPASEKVMKPEGKREEKLVTGEGKILMMDDEEGVINIGGRMLEELGYDVEFASDGEEAIEMYRKARQSGEAFDAVILDLTVPGGMGGRQCIKKLIEIEPDIKAIVSSGYSTNPIMANHAEYGFSGMLAKPYRIEDLGKELDRILKES